jgi:Arc/MetJ-type ribon-helix-helix transcriptional regulator
MSDELTEILFVRMTKKERDAVHKAAKHDNFRSDSEWVRHALRDAAAKKA